MTYILYVYFKGKPRKKLYAIKTSGLFFFSESNLTAAWLAQLVERQSAVREVEGSSPRPDQHSGS